MYNSGGEGVAKRKSVSITLSSKESGSYSDFFASLMKTK